ncbi:hypothetical protein [Streptomyces sp. NPDC096339]|uniref:hypothetical protein n=1 Tax=Streptomyces sp. NPDC096339 TaxID=3366086 RepID=UPI00381F64EF
MRAHRRAATKRGLDRTDPRTLPRWADQRDPPRLRRTRPSPDLRTGRGTLNDYSQAENVIALIRVASTGPELTRLRPERVIAHKGYSSGKIRTYLRRHHIGCTIPERIDQISGRQRRIETPCRIGRAAPWRRYVIERSSNRLKQNKPSGPDLQTGVSPCTVALKQACSASKFTAIHAA